MKKTTEETTPKPVKLFTLLGNLQEVTEEENAAREELAARHEVEMSQLSAQFSGAKAELIEQITNHPERAQFAIVLEGLGITENGRKQRKAEPETPQFELVMPNGEVITQYVRKMKTVAPALKAVIGDNLEGCCLKSIETGEVVADNLTWRKDREVKAA